MSTQEWRNHRKTNDCATPSSKAILSVNDPRPQLGALLFTSSERKAWKILARLNGTFQNGSYFKAVRIWKETYSTSLISRTNVHFCIFSSLAHNSFNILDSWNKMGALQKTMVKVSATVFLFVACLSVLITFSGKLYHTSAKVFFFISFRKHDCSCML